MRAVLVGWARVDPHGALDRLSSVPSAKGPGLRAFSGTTASMVLKEAAIHDFDSTMAWIGQNHEQLGVF